MRWPLVFGIVVMAAAASRTATSQKLEVAVKDRTNAYASLAARRSGAPMNHAEHQHLESGQRPSDGVARAQLSRLWFARLGSAESPKALTGGVCYCCKTAIATESDGAIVAPNGLIVAWDEQAKGTRHIAAARASIDSSGAARFVRQPIGDGIRAEYPSLASVADGALVAWTSGSVGQTVLRVERLVN
jgi:hypothetical protein